MRAEAEPPIRRATEADTYIVPLLRGHLPGATERDLKALTESGYPRTDGSRFVHMERHVTPTDARLPRELRGKMTLGINYWVPSNGGREAVVLLCDAFRSVLAAEPAAASQPVYGIFDTEAAAQAGATVFGAVAVGRLAYHLNLAQCLATGAAWLAATGAATGGAAPRG